MLGCDVLTEEHGGVLLEGEGVFGGEEAAGATLRDALVHVGMPTEVVL